MKRILTLLAALAPILSWGLGPASAADVEAGRATARACAACHGENGISVSDDIPNLAGQKAVYLGTQLKAFRGHERTNGLMNPIAGQLSDTEIENLAAYFSSLPGGSGSEASKLLPHLTADRVNFPTDYKESFTRYTTISFPKRKQLRHYYANPAALEAAKAGGAFPNGSLLFVEVFKAKLDAGGEPVKGEDGHFQADKLAAYTAMEKQPGWGKTVPELLRNGDWSYAVFTPDKTRKAGVNEAKCLACHKPEAAQDYVFSLPAMQEKARAAE